MSIKDYWKDFVPGRWQDEADVRQFIQLNYTPYEGDDSFLVEKPTEATQKLWNKVMQLTKEERERGGVWDLDTKLVSLIDSHGPGYLDKDLEKIVGVQTDEPFKRSLQPFGGIRMAEVSAESYGYHVDEEVSEIFTKYRKTHNQGVFDAYTPEMRAARRSGVITGLPDAYGRGRIIGDYRRVALYGIDWLITDKKKQLNTTSTTMTADTIRDREELSEQIRALAEIKNMAASYGVDISNPATNAQEAIQWVYFGYLAAVKEQNGAAMSLGRTSTFIDIYVERDIAKGLLTEEQAQEIVDHFIMKLRIVKFARTPEYNSLFSGDPTWVTESLAGVGIDGRPMATKTSFRYLNTLNTLGPAPEPNMTVLWSTHLPKGFKDFCAKMSIKTSSIQYENDDLMRVTHGDDYAIACCVSPMRVGKEMQFFGARSNLAKCLLYAINGGKDEKSGAQVAPRFEAITDEYITYDAVYPLYVQMMEWLAELYVNTLNVIHFMHDKYAYERAQMALHDREVRRYFATGIAGLSVAADSLSALKYAKVKAIRNEDGLVVDFETEGEFPCYGNNDDRVDSIAIDLVEKFMNMIRKHHTYRNGYPTMSVLTITSNVVYGKKTGNTPDGRRAGEPFAPGANPMHGRDKNGALASLESVAKIPFKHASDGISNTFTIIPGALGKDDQIIVGDLNINLDGRTPNFDFDNVDCDGDTACKIPNLTDGVDGK